MSLLGFLLRPSKCGPLLSVMCHHPQRKYPRSQVPRMGRIRRGCATGNGRQGDRDVYQKGVSGTQERIKSPGNTMDWR
jgi:hypothetical protein